MTPMREDRQALQRAAREHVDDAEDRARRCRWKKRASALRVDARHRNERADAVDDQPADQEQQALAHARRNAPRRRVLMPGSVSCLPRCLAVLGLLLGRSLRASGSQCLDRAAGLLDGCARALGGADALERHGLLDLARQDDLRAIGECRRTMLAFFSARGRSVAPSILCKLVQAHFGAWLRSSSGSRPSAGGAAAASGRLRSRPCGSRPCARAGPSRRGRRSCPGRRKRRARRAGASCGLPRAGLMVVQSHGHRSLPPDLQQVLGARRSCRGSAACRRLPPSGAAAQAEAAHRGADVLQLPVHALHERDLDLLACHGALPWRSAQ